MAQFQGIMTQYRERLPILPNTPVVSLNEGNTPLIQLTNLAKTLPASYQIWVKIEGLNPTGSFKDRGMTLAVSKALEAGSRAIICASTGNTSASAAAYAARAGIQAFVIIPAGNIALGKLAQAMMHGACVIQINDNFDEGLRLVKEIAAREEITLVNSINPYRLQGQKTAAFEVVEQLGQAPDYHCLPVGNAGNISAYWMGYCEYQTEGIIDKSPVMLGYQASGAAPFLRGDPVDKPETVASAIRIGNPASWDKAIEAQTQSGGWFAECQDAEILRAQQLLASTEGIFCEPASAISIAGLLKDIAANKIPEDSTIVCTLTGHGLKDPDIAIKQTKEKLHTAPADLSALEKIIRNLS